MTKLKGKKNHKDKDQDQFLCAFVLAIFKLTAKFYFSLQDKTKRLRQTKDFWLNFIILKSVKVKKKMCLCVLADFSVICRSVTASWKHDRSCSSEEKDRKGSVSKGREGM